MYTAGIDLGSTAIKAVFVKDKKIVWHKAVPTAPGQEAIAQLLIDEGKASLNINEADIDGIATTGYGKKLLSSADKTIDEVSANSLGVYTLSNGNARVIVNIGGQDIKIIMLDETGKLTDFKMNDKCAAGTGRFFEMAARILDTSIYNFSDLSAKAETAANINSTCVVFAESEIVSLLAKGTSKESIIKGLHESIARRIASLMGDITVDTIYLDGGSANNTALQEAISDELFTDVEVLDLPQFSVAFGAAISLCVSGDGSI